MRLFCMASIVFILAATPAAGDDSFCGQWGNSWDASTKTRLVEKLVDGSVDRGLRQVPGLIACAKRNMIIQKPAISKMCVSTNYQADFTTGLFMGQLISWIAVKCGNDTSFTSQPRIQ